MLPPDRKRFRHALEARDFVERLPRNPQTTALLRRILAEEAPGLDLRRIDAHQVRRELASRIALGGVRVEERLDRFEPFISGGEAKKSEPAPKSGGDAPRSAIAPPKTKTWITFRVLDDVTSEPIPGVSLKVKTPEGWLKALTTDQRGEAGFKNIDPGTYDISCDLKGARRKTTLDYVSIGVGPDEWEPPDIPKNQRRYKPGSYIIAHVDPHHVQTGESIESLAIANGMTWQDLSIFNWGTKIPREINKHLIEEVGVTARAPDGINWSFRTEDKPGIVYIPTEFAATGLATGLTHEVRVKKDNEFLIILENQKGLRIPECDYEATFADGSVRAGTTGTQGVDIVANPPSGAVTIEWKDFDAIEAKSLAACARKACDERNPRDLYRLLEHSPKIVQMAIDAYARYYNDHTGQGLIEDIYAEVTDPIAVLAVEALMIKAGLQPKSGLVVDSDQGDA